MFEFIPAVRRKREAQEAAERARLMAYRPLTEALAASGKKAFVEGVPNYGHVVAAVGPKHVMKPDREPITTGASQWSTIDYKPRGYRALRSAVTVSSQGHVLIRPEVVRENVQHWNWLLHNPRLTYKVVQNVRAKKQRLQDSALFL